MGTPNVQSCTDSRQELLPIRKVVQVIVQVGVRNAQNSTNLVACTGTFYGMAQ